MNYFAKDTQQVLDELNTCADGLTTQEAGKTAAGTRPKPTDRNQTEKFIFGFFRTV